MNQPFLFTPRPVPRWLTRLAVGTVLLAIPVLMMGALTTTFAVGMSDPVPSTAPWFLAVNSGVLLQEPVYGFRLEHTHRFFAWLMGGATVVLAVGLWRAEPTARFRRLGTVTLVILLICYAGLHGEIRGVWAIRQAGGPLGYPVWAVTEIDQPDTACGVMQ